MSPCRTSGSCLCALPYLPHPSLAAHPQGRCNREKPACKYFHPPQHLKDQLLINGRNHLALKNALAQQMQQQIIPGQMPTVVSLTITLTLALSLTLTLISTLPSPSALPFAHPAQPQGLPQFASPYASVPLTYSPYLPGLVSPLLQGQEQGVVQPSPPPLQPTPQSLPQQQKQRSDRIEVSPQPTAPTVKYIQGPIAN